MICTTLVSAEQLRSALEPASGAAPVVVVECSFDLADAGAGEASWRAGHLPASIYLHLERDLSGAKTGPNGEFRGRHPLPARADFATLNRSSPFLSGGNNPWVIAYRKL